MHKHSIVMATVLTGMSFASLWPAQAATSSVESGKDLALLVCSYCHVVAADQIGSPKLAQVQRTPSFEEIANNPRTTAQSLRSFLGKTHWDEKTIPITMPNPLLMDQQRDDVVRYILSLKRRQ